MQKFIFNFSVDNKNSLKAAITNFGKNFPHKVTRGFTDFFSAISNLLKSQSAKNADSVNKQIISGKVTFKTIQKNSLFLDDTKTPGTGLGANDFTSIKNNILNADNIAAQKTNTKESALPGKLKSAFAGINPEEAIVNSGDNVTNINSSLRKNNQIVQNNSGSEKTKMARDTKQGENQVAIPEIDFKTFVRLINNIAKNHNNVDLNFAADAKNAINENNSVNQNTIKSENKSLALLAAEPKKVQKTVFNLLKELDGFIKKSAGTEPVKSQIFLGGKFTNNKIELALKGNELQISAPEKLQNKISKALPYVKELINNGFNDAVSNNSSPGKVILQNEQNTINPQNQKYGNKEIAFKLITTEKGDQKNFKQENRIKAAAKDVSSGNPGIENKVASNVTFDGQTPEIKKQTVATPVKRQSVKADFSEKIKEVNPTAKFEENIPAKVSLSKIDPQNNILTKADQESVKIKTANVRSSRIIKSNRLKEAPDLKQSFRENADNPEIITKRTTQTGSEGKSHKAENFTIEAPEKSFILKTTMRDILQNFGLRSSTAKKSEMGKSVKANVQSMATVAAQPVIQKQQTKTDSIKTPDKATPILANESVINTNESAKKEKQSSLSAKNEQKNTKHAGFDFQQSAAQNAGDKNKFFSLDESSPNTQGREEKHFAHIQTQKTDENQVFGKEQILKTVQAEIPKAAGVVKYISNIINNYYESPTSTFRQSQIIVDGGKLGDLDIRFKENASTSSILIVVENDSIKAEMQRLLPIIMDSLNSKGVNVSAINIDVGQSDHKNEKQNGSKKSHNKYVSQTEENNEQKSTLKQTRYYGYNTMDIVA